jgi:filamentous hemagglutinin
MKRRLTFFLAATLLLAAAAAQWAVARPAPAAAGSGSPELSQAALQAPAQAPGATAAARALVVRNVVVRDLDGRVAWRGDVDLRPTLRRIEAGVRDRHRNDGGVFGNRERRLPVKPRRYYLEYVVRTPGISHAGPQRLIVGKGGELFYTFDHYASFRRIR